MISLSMERNAFRRIPTIAILAISTFIITCNLFDTPFANRNIDWLSLITGLFLISEGFYKIFFFKKNFYPFQLFRIFRIIIGICIFSVHLFQYIYGATYNDLTSIPIRLFIDWAAFLFGIFLIVEGINRVLSSDNEFTPDQITRYLRVVIGSSVFTIHLLQFMRV